MGGCSLRNLGFSERVDKRKSLKTFAEYLTLQPQAVCDARSFFKRSTNGLNSEFPCALAGCITKAKEPNMFYYLPIAGEKIVGFMSFLRSLTGSKTQIALSKIWITHKSWYIIKQRNQTKLIP